MATSNPADGMEAHQIEQAVRVGLVMVNGKWRVDSRVFDGEPLRGNDDVGASNMSCACDDPEGCQWARDAAAFVPLPTGRELIKLLRQAQLFPRADDMLTSARSLALCALFAETERQSDTKLNLHEVEYATGLGEKWIEWAMEELLRDQLVDYVMDLNRRAYFLTDKGVRVARKIVAKVDVGGLTAVLRPTVEERNRKTAIAVKRAYQAGRSIRQIILDRRIRRIAGGVLSHSTARNILTRQGVKLRGRGGAHPRNVHTVKPTGE